MISEFGSLTSFDTNCTIYNKVFYVTAPPEEEVNVVRCPSAAVRRHQNRWSRINITDSSNEEAEESILEVEFDVQSVFTTRADL